MNMKRIFFLLAIGISASAIAQVGIGTNMPNAKSILDLTSTEKGFLPPRMTAVQRLAINPANPARGLMVFDTDSLAYMFWTGSAWQKLGAAGSNYWSLQGNTLTGSEKLGSLNAQPLVIVSANTQMLRIDTGRIGAVALPRFLGGSELNQISSGAANTILNGGQGAAQKNVITSGNFNQIGNGKSNRIVGANFGTIHSGTNNKFGSASAPGFFDHGLIGGGVDNELTASFGLIGMGDSNLIMADFGFIGNGQANEIKPNSGFSFIGSGDSLKVVQGIGNFIGGGKASSIAGTQYNAVVNGFRNRIISGSQNLIGNGEYHEVSGDFNTILGGTRDTVSGKYNSIISGLKNTITGGANYSIIGTGYDNEIKSPAIYGGIFAGSDNQVSATNAMVGAGSQNLLSGYGSFIGGGYKNKVTNYWSSIVAGASNTNEAEMAMIGTGRGNKIFAGADSSFIGSGGGNYVVGNAASAVVVGGRENGVGNDYSVVVGGRENVVEGPLSFIGGGVSNRVIGSYGTIAAGWQNLIDEGIYSSILGGRANYALQGNYITIGGGYRNVVEDQAHFGTISGGDSNRIQMNVIYGSIGAGKSNVLVGNANYSTIGGGQKNKVEKPHSVIAGGLNNWSRGDYSTVAGGNTNEAGGDYSAVLGGGGNSAAQEYATVLGGRYNNAWGKYGVAAGYKSNITHSSVFMFADMRASGNYFDSKADGQFMARVLNGALFTDEDTSSIVRAQIHSRSGGPIPQFMADQVNDDFARIRFRSAYALTNYWDVAARVSTGEFNIFRNGTGNVLQLSPTSATNLMMMSNGARLTIGGAWTNASDRNAKDGISEINEEEILDKLAQLPLSSWHYKTEAQGVQHIGPMAQDFKETFGLGDSDKSIATVDADGVNMAAIKALYKRLQKLEKQNEELTRQIRELKKDLK